MQKTRYTTSEPCHSNLSFQILLYVNIYVSIFWAMLYGYQTILHCVHIGDLRARAVLVFYILTLILESCRLYSGYAANLRWRPGAFLSFLVLSPFVMLPTLLILRYNAYTLVYYVQLSTTVLIVFITLEFIAAGYTYIVYCKKQAERLRSARNFTNRY